MDSNVSDFSMRSKFMNDGAKTVHNIHNKNVMCHGERAYDQIA